MRTRKNFGVTLLVLALCLVLTACSGSSQEPVQEGDKARAFSTELVDGGTFRLSDQKGKVVLLNFWATWCGPCVGEMPAFTRLVETYGDQLSLLAVNSGEDEATVRSFLEQNGYTFPVALDTNGQIGALYPTDGIPYTLIIDPDGTVSSIQLGAGDAESMFAHYSALVDRALK